MKELRDFINFEIKLLSKFHKAFSFESTARLVTVIENKLQELNDLPVNVSIQYSERVFEALVIKLFESCSSAKR